MFFKKVQAFIIKQKGCIINSYSLFVIVLFYYLTVFKTSSFTFTVYLFLSKLTILFLNNFGNQQ
jgi:hypothetical protein